MRNFQQKKVWGNIFQSKPVLILLAIVIIFSVWSVLKFWNKMEETGKNKEIVEEKVAALKEQKEKLLIDINSLNTEEGKEKVFRENFGLAKEGEDLVVVVEDKKSKEAPKESTFSGFLSFFKNLFK